MSEPIQAIDTSVLDELVAIRREHEQLGQFRERAEGMKSRVEAQVYERVVRDYDTRESALLERAKPLQARARAEFRKLRARLDEVSATRRTAEIDKAEVEFRHGVGEIDDEERARRIADPEGVLASCQEELDAIDKLKARFLEAYPQVEADAAGADAPPPPTAAASAPPVPPAAVPAEPVPPAAAPAIAATPRIVPPVSDETGEVKWDTSAEPAEEPVAFSASDDTPDLAAEVAHEASRASDVQEPPDNVLPLAAAADVQPEADDDPLAIHQAATQMFEVPEEFRAAARESLEGPDVPDTDTDATFILPDAVLVDETRGAGEFRLGAMNYIGRADDNQIRLKSGDISRRHAMISVANGAYLLRDLQSQNGTYVNGQRVAEHVLAEGDRVRVGNIELVFHYGTSHRADAGGIAVGSES